VFPPYVIWIGGNLEVQFKGTRYKRKPWKYQVLAAYGFISGVILLITVFVIIPMVGALLLGFFRYDAIRPPLFIGLDNFRMLMADIQVWKGLWLTLYYLLGSLPVTMALAFGLAIVLCEKWLKGKKIFTTIFFIPYALPFVGAAFIWTWLLNPLQGVVNYLLELMGASPQNWFRDASMAMPSVWVVANWKFLGFFLIMYVAAIQNIPNVYYEAAKIDGITTKWQEIRYITWPLVLPTTFFLLIMGCIGAFNAFDIIFITTQGGPYNSTRILIYYIYELAFHLNRFGKGSALAIIMFVLLLGLTYFQWKYYTGRVEER